MTWNGRVEWYVCGGSRRRQLSSQAELNQAKPVDLNGALQGADLEPKLAKMAADGSLELLCEEADGVVDGGVLQEASKVGVGENATRVSSSRAGSSAVIPVPRPRDLRPH